MIIGDSNLSRFPKIWDPCVQVDRFPGAKFSHAAQLLRNGTPPSPQVTKVILSFGMNDSHTTNPSHLRETLGTLYNVGRATFPNATVLIPLINVSNTLPTPIQHNLKYMNELIKTYNAFIPRLEKTKFSTMTDGIHWKQETADDMWKHWRAFLG